MTKRTKKTDLPVSHARNAYDLLSEVAQLTLAEPRRMRMAHWGGDKGNGVAFENPPACNTVGCIGGWVEALTDHQQSARGVLGITNAQEDDLFFGPLCNEPDQGTPQHARHVVAMIRAFQRKHARQLKAKKLEPVSR